MSFFEAVKSAFSNYCKFDGRARRSEYWYFTLSEQTSMDRIQRVCKIS